MNILIPMAGLGQRFKDAGYTIPKYLLEFQGTTLLEAAARSLPIERAHRIIFAARKEEAEKVNLAELVQRYFPDFETEIYLLDAETRGQAETVLLAATNLPGEESILIFNIDTVFECSRLKGILDDKTIDGLLGSFQSSEDRFSFARTNADGEVVEVKEKEVISENALSGLYFFRRLSDFRALAKEAMSQNKTVKGEYYIAPLYDELIANGGKVCLAPVDSITILGTPEEYEEACGR